MSYGSKTGKRPIESASKISHAHIVRDKDVKEFISHCSAPGVITDDSSMAWQRFESQDAPSSISHIIAVDGSYSEIPLDVNARGNSIAFFQFGALIFSIKDLESIDKSAFIDPDDMAKIRNIERLKLTFPLRGLLYKSQTSLTHSIRLALYEFFINYPSKTESFMETLKWFIFEDYKVQSLDFWSLSSCPYCSCSPVTLKKSTMLSSYKFLCSNCSQTLYMTDVFRLHEAIDDEFGASGVLGYILTTLEQLLIVHLIRLSMKRNLTLLKQVLFIKDGPLAYFGQTANLHKPMRSLIDYLSGKNSIFMAGLEKSGAFVEYAMQNAPQVDPGSILLLDNDFIYQNIIPGKGSAIYGETTYYGKKVIYKTLQGAVYVITIPVDGADFLKQKLKLEDYIGINEILSHISKLKCDMYDDALLPIALANKLVSLSLNPGQKILQKFAKSAI